MNIRAFSTLMAIYLCFLSADGMQGDAEKKRGIPVSPLCDRDKVEVPKSQLAFLTYVVKPTFEALKGLAPVTAGNALDNIDIAVRHWEQQVVPV